MQDQGSGERFYEVAPKQDDKDLTGPQASFGIASLPNHRKSSEVILSSADEAFYRAKAKGGNIVISE